MLGSQRAERMHLHKIWLVLPLHIGERQIMQVWNISEPWASPFLNQMLFPRCTVLTSDWWFVGRDGIWHHMVRHLAELLKVVEGEIGITSLPLHAHASPCPALCWLVSALPCAYINVLPSRTICFLTFHPSSKVERVEKIREAGK